MGRAGKLHLFWGGKVKGFCLIQIIKHGAAMSNEPKETNTRSSTERTDFLFFLN